MSHLAAIMALESTQQGEATADGVSAIAAVGHLDSYTLHTPRDWKEWT